MIIIPTETDSPSYTQVITIGDAAYNVGFNWNEREGFWYMDIADANNAPIVVGIKLVANWNLTQQYKDSRLPDGFILCVDQSGSGRDPGRNDLGSRCVVTFIATNELTPV